MPMGCSESNGHTRHSSPLALGFSSGEIQPPVRRAFIGDRPTRAHIGADKRDSVLSHCEGISSPSDALLGSGCPNCGFGSVRHRVILGKCRVVGTEKVEESSRIKWEFVKKKSHRER